MRLLFGFIIGAVSGLVLAVSPALAYRTARPPEFHEWTTNTFTQLNDVLLQFYNVVNGRYAMDRVTITPKGNRNGGIGETVFFDTGTDQICVKVGTAITAWSCTNLTPL